ncbi:MAG: hypothetical protein Q4G12_03180 [Bacteroidales bacterium]|nr:hypothetical protein [Bacteroidales bacterium]
MLKAIVIIEKSTTIHFALLIDKSMSLTLTLYDRHGTAIDHLQVLSKKR